MRTSSRPSSVDRRGGARGVPVPARSPAGRPLQLASTTPARPRHSTSRPLTATRTPADDAPFAFTPISPIHFSSQLMRPVDEWRSPVKPRPLATATPTHTAARDGTVAITHEDVMSLLATLQRIDPRGDLTYIRELATHCQDGPRQFRVGPESADRQAQASTNPSPPFATSARSPFRPASGSGPFLQTRSSPLGDLTRSDKDRLQQQYGSSPDRMHDSPWRTDDDYVPPTQHTPVRAGLESAYASSVASSPSTLTDNAFFNPFAKPQRGGATPTTMHDMTYALPVEKNHYHSQHLSYLDGLAHPSPQRPSAAVLAGVGVLHEAPSKSASTFLQHQFAEMNLLTHTAPPTTHLAPAVPSPVRTPADRPTTPKGILKNVAGGGHTPSHDSHDAAGVESQLAHLHAASPSLHRSPIAARGASVPGSADRDSRRRHSWVRFEDEALQAAVSEQLDPPSASVAAAAAHSSPSSASTIDSDWLIHAADDAAIDMQVSSPQQQRGSRGTSPLRRPITTTTNPASQALSTAPEEEDESRRPRTPDRRRRSSGGAQTPQPDHPSPRPGHHQHHHHASPSSHARSASASAVLAQESVSSVPRSSAQSAFDRAKEYGKLVRTSLSPRPPSRDANNRPRSPWARTSRQDHPLDGATHTKSIFSNEALQEADATSTVVAAQQSAHRSHSRSHTPTRRRTLSPTSSTRSPSAPPSDELHRRQEQQANRRHSHSRSEESPSYHKHDARATSPSGGVLTPPHIGSPFTPTTPWRDSHEAVVSREHTPNSASRRSSARAPLQRRSITPPLTQISPHTARPRSATPESISHLILTYKESQEESEALEVDPRLLAPNPYDEEEEAEEAEDAHEQVFDEFLAPGNDAEVSYASDAHSLRTSSPYQAAQVWPAPDPDEASEETTPFSHAPPTRVASVSDSHPPAAAAAAAVPKLKPFQVALLARGLAKSAAATSRSVVESVTRESSVADIIPWRKRKVQATTSTAIAPTAATSSATASATSSRAASRANSRPHSPHRASNTAGPTAPKTPDAPAASAEHSFSPTLHRSPRYAHVQSVVSRAVHAKSASVADPSSKSAAAREARAAAARRVEVAPSQDESLPAPRLDSTRSNLIAPLALTNYRHAPSSLVSPPPAAKKVKSSASAGGTTTVQPTITSMMRPMTKRRSDETEATTRTRVPEEHGITSPSASAGTTTTRPARPSTPSRIPVYSPTGSAAHRRAGMTPPV